MSKDKIIIFDTTLRDGEQCPGASLNLKEKLEIARQLSILRVDVIEAGFPVASPGDFESVRQIANEIRGSQIAALARALEKDIEVSARALEKAESPRIHIFLSTSKTHRVHMVQKAKEEIISMTEKSICFAKKFCDNIEFSPMDATRTEPDFLVEAVQAAIGAGATTVNIPDTVGYTTPGEFAKLIEYLKQNVSNIKKAVISVHCHNDLGLAVANSLAAIEAGARQVECTVNGLGERAGNAALEEIVMALRTRNDVYHCDTGVNTQRLYPTSRLVADVTGMRVQRNKATVGANAFAHEAGIHQHGMLQERTTYEIMRPEDVGFAGTNLVLGKHSGRHAFRQRLEELGIRIDDERLDHAFEQFKRLADRKKDIYDEDIEALVREEVEVVPETFKTQIDSSVTFPQMFDEATAHQGAVVLLGGEVLSAKRLIEGTRLEILQLPLDGSEEPVLDRTASQCRFLAFESTFLDPATLPPNTRVTLVGEVTGATGANLDEMEYRYPTLNIKHLYVWPEPDLNQPDNSGPRYGIFGGGGSGVGGIGGGVSIGIGF